MIGRRQKDLQLLEIIKGAIDSFRKIHPDTKTIDLVYFANGFIPAYIGYRRLLGILRKYAETINCKYHPPVYSGGRRTSKPKLTILVEEEDA